MKSLLLFPILGILLLSSPSGIAEETSNQPNENDRAASHRIENAIPVLPVRDLARSIEFYTHKLGFKLDWGGAAGDKVCSVSRNKRPIMLQERDKIDTPSWVWMGADLALFDTFRAAGVKVFQEPKNYSWGYEMKFEDIDGNVLWLGSDPRHDLPFEDAKKQQWGQRRMARVRRKRKMEGPALPSAIYTAFRLSGPLRRNRTTQPSEARQLA